MLTGEMSGRGDENELKEGERLRSRLETSLKEAVALIGVGEEGWLERFKKVAASVTPFENGGRQMVMRMLVWRMGREGASKGIDCDESVRKMSEVMEDLRREYEAEKEDVGEGRMMKAKSPTVYMEWRRRTRRLVDMVASVLTVMEHVLMRG